MYKSLFPYDSFRSGQENLLKKIYENVSEHKNLLISAPTGLGKTVSAIAPTLKIAKDKELTILYLTSRQTQINQVLKTLKEINLKHNVKISAVGLVGKRNMCIHPGKGEYYGNEFNDFCKKMREIGKCKYYKNTRKEENEKNIKKIINSSREHFYTIEEFTDECETFNLCPYEIASRKLFKADVIVCDFNYFFNFNIRDLFLGKLGRTIDEIIVIVDEAHNLPDRIRNMYSSTLSIQGILRALKESRDFFKEEKYDQLLNLIKEVIEKLYEKKLEKKDEGSVEKEEFINEINKKVAYEKLIDELRIAEAEVKDQRIISHIGRVANFLENWKIAEEGFLRVIKKKKTQKGDMATLEILNIDPSIITGEILNTTYSSILMSATLTPLEMYRDVLGLSNCEFLELESPFPKENLGVFILDDVTTKYSLRNEEMYKRYGYYIEEIINRYDKNTIIFFPSYDLLEKIICYIDYAKSGKRILIERNQMIKEEKEQFIKYFKDPFKKTVLFGVTSGSFGEGLDLPYEALEIVIVVGLPLPRPTLVIEEVIKLYDKKFGKGRDYGYVFPAMAKIVQAAGRCIRTEKDRGIVILMDNRFKWPYYAKAYPKFWAHKKFDFKEIDKFFYLKQRK